MLTSYVITLLLYVPISMGQEDTACPDGYILMKGDIPGMGQVKSETVDSLTGCGDLCAEEKTCCSFEYSPGDRLCNINKDYRVTNIQAGDYLFCKRDAQSKQFN